MISDAELEAMRATLDESLPDSCQIRRATLASDGAGNMVPTWATVATVACRKSPSGNTPAERAVAERVASENPWTVTLPAGTDVRPADRLLIGSDTLEVVAPIARSWEISRRVVCVEVK